MNCPECDYTTSDYIRDYIGDEYNWLFIHVWSYHRERRDRNTKGYLKKPFPCPWCELLDPKWDIASDEKKSILRGEHLKDCLPYIATCLAGVRIQ